MLNVLWWTMLVIYVPACIGLIVVVLLQKGKGTGFAGAFGMGGGGDAVFGPRSGKSLPQKLTTLMAALFMILALGMSLIGGKISSGPAPDKEDPSGYKATIGTELDGLGLGTGQIGTATDTVEPEAKTTEAAGVNAPEAPTANLSNVSSEVTMDSFQDVASDTLTESENTTPETVPENSTD